MAGQISAAEGAILKGADTVSATRDDLKARIAAVESQMAAIGSNWTGPAATAFHTLMARWNDEASKVNNALIQFEDNLRSAQRDYDTADQEQESTFANLASRLG